MGQGQKQIREKFRQLLRDAPDAVARALLDGAQEIRIYAHTSITRGSASGHKGGKHQHIPSRPGQPPKNDSGTLVDSFDLDQPNPREVLITVKAPYAAALEFGTSKMEARPFLRPARDAKADAVREKVVSAMNRVVRK